MPRTKEEERAYNKAYYAANRQRLKARTSAWYEANRERASEYHRNYRAENAEKRRAYEGSYYERNAERMKASARRLSPGWRQKNRERLAAKQARHRAQKLRASPAWADFAAIRLIYAACRSITESTGTEHHVDHIIPLRGKIVCGLHVAENLQILRGPENQSKGARFWPDMPDPTSRSVSGSSRRQPMTEVLSAQI